MKQIYIPQGESRTFEQIVTETLVVEGYLNVIGSIKANSVSGNGVITAAEISADSIAIGDLETTTVVCRRLLAKRVRAAQIFASDWATVSQFLFSAYVETGKLTMALSEVDEIKAAEVTALKPGKRGMFLTLLLSVLRSFWLFLAEGRSKRDKPLGKRTEKAPETEKTGALDPALRDEIVRTVRECLEDTAEAPRKTGTPDFELQRIEKLFCLLRDSGYTLRILPGTPEENAPNWGIEQEDRFRTAA